MACTDLIAVHARFRSTRLVVDTKHYAGLWRADRLCGWPRSAAYGRSLVDNAAALEIEVSP